MKKFCHICLFILLLSFTPLSPVSAFLVGSMSDSQYTAAALLNLSKQMATLNPTMVLFNGDIDPSGTTTTGLKSKTDALNNAGLLNRTFVVRGNHDTKQGTPATLQK